jgi:hypothetical protein
VSRQRHDPLDRRRIDRVRAEIAHHPPFLDQFGEIHRALSGSKFNVQSSKLGGLAVNLRISQLSNF